MRAFHKAFVHIPEKPAADPASCQRGIELVLAAFPRLQCVNSSRMASPRGKGHTPARDPQRILTKALESQKAPQGWPGSGQGLAPRSSISQWRIGQGRKHETDFTDRTAGSPISCLWQQPPWGLDGVHLGHQEVIGTTWTYACKHNLQPDGSWPSRHPILTVQLNQTAPALDNANKGRWWKLGVRHPG